MLTIQTQSNSSVFSSIQFKCIKLRKVIKLALEIHIVNMQQMLWQIGNPKLGQCINNAPLVARNTWLLFNTTVLFSIRRKSKNIIHNFQHQFKKTIFDALNLPMFVSFNNSLLSFYFPTLQGSALKNHCRPMQHQKGSLLYASGNRVGLENIPWERHDTPKTTEQAYSASHGERTMSKTTKQAYTASHRNNSVGPRMQVKPTPVPTEQGQGLKQQHPTGKA